MAATLTGERSWSMTRDADGHRDYVLDTLVQVDIGDGPFEALNCPDLHQPGEPWDVLGDHDSNAYCLQTASVKPYSKEGDPTMFFLVSQTFSTKCTDQRCKVSIAGDPVATIPRRWSGGSVKYSDEAVYDKDGNKIVNSAQEPIRGPQNEWERAKSQVRLIVNDYDLNLAGCQAAVNCVNKYDMPGWGVTKRQLRLAEFSWELKACGDCVYYYEKSFHFEIDKRSQGWDRLVLDEGTKVLHGQWDRSTGVYSRTVPQGVSGTLNPDSSGNYNNTLPLIPNPEDPTHYTAFRDRKGDYVRVLYSPPITYPDGNVLKGLPFVAADSTPQYWWCVKYQDGLQKTFYDTCDRIKRNGMELGWLVKGPYDTEAAATLVCNNPFLGADDDVQAAVDLNCGVVAYEPNSVLIQFYPEIDFVSQLNIPALIGG